MLEWKVTTPQSEVTGCVLASEAGQLEEHPKIYIR